MAAIFSWPGGSALGQPDERACPHGHVQRIGASRLRRSHNATTTIVSLSHRRRSCSHACGRKKARSVELLWEPADNNIFQFALHSLKALPLKLFS